MCCRKQLEWHVINPLLCLCAVDVDNVPPLCLTWQGKQHSAYRRHPNTQGGGGPGSHRHLPKTDTEN